MRQTVSVCLPPDILFNVDRFCESTLISRSDLITRALGVYFVANARGAVEVPIPTKPPPQLGPRIMRRLERLGNKSKQWALLRPFVSSTTAEEREKALAQVESYGFVRRTLVAPPRGRPYVLVEALPEGKAWDEVAPPLEARSPDADMERLAAMLRERGGKATVSYVSSRFQRWGRSRRDDAVSGLIAKGLAEYETEPAGARPGRPRTWITLLPAKAPVSPVASSMEQEASTLASAAGSAYAPDSASVDTVAAPAAGEVAP